MKIVEPYRYMSCTQYVYIIEPKDKSVILEQNISRIYKSQGWDVLSVICMLPFHWYHLGSPWAVQEYSGLTLSSHTLPPASAKYTV